MLNDPNDRKYMTDKPNHKQQPQKGKKTEGVLKRWLTGDLLLLNADREASAGVRVVMD